jgi:peptide/nickel transport system substrate-binding protein
VLSKIAIKDNLYLIEALNDSTLRIVLSESFPPFLGILAMKYCSVIPFEAIEYYGDEFRSNPVGTGPFMMQNWVENIKLVLKRNPDYFEYDNGQRLPYLDGVAISFLIDKMTAFMEFVKGNFDFMSGIDASYKDEILTRGGKLKEKFENKFNLITSPYLNTEYLAMFVGHPEDNSSPLNRLNVRKAINYGFNRQKMIRYLRNGIGLPGNSGIVPAGMLSFDSTGSYGYNYNPLLAQELLKEEGYNENNPIPDITLTTTPDYLDLSKFVQSQLKDIGMNIKIDVSPTATVRELKANGKLEFFRASWIADYPDEENYLSMFYSKNKAPMGPNYTHFSTTSVDSLYEFSFSVNSRSQRTNLYRTIDSTIMQYSPVAILYYDQVTLFTQKDIFGLTSNPINMLNLEKVKKNKAVSKVE